MSREGDGAEESDRAQAIRQTASVTEAEELVARRRAEGHAIDFPIWSALALRHAAEGDLVGADQVIDRMLRELPAAKRIVPALRRILAVEA